MPESSAKRLEWAIPARLAFEATLERIAEEDVETAALVERRVSRSLSLLRLQPAMGTPGTVAGRRTYAIPNTGHSVNYRIGREAIIILRWYRQRQNVSR